MVVVVFFACGDGVRGEKNIAVMILNFYLKMFFGDEGRTGTHYFSTHGALVGAICTLETTCRK